MTIEEKARAYDEALEDMRVIYPNLKGDAKLAVEHAFPQLRESEDERIRKEMIAYFAHRADVTEFIDEGEDCKRWISYLEKQKEQKPIDYPYLPGWRKNRDNNKPELKRSVLMLTTHGVAEGEWLGEKWCQYRWSCELKDGEVLYWIHLSDLKRLEKEGEEKQQEQKPNIEICPHSIKSKSYSMQKEQKPISQADFDTAKHEALWDEQKPDWSEEDEKKMIFLERLIEHNVPDGQYGWADGRKGGFVTKSEAISILKSLRPQPHWKPSEEQMKALQWWAYQDDELRSLLNDLKKL